MDTPKACEYLFFLFYIYLCFYNSEDGFISIADIERVHQIQEEGAAPNHDAQIAAARKAYPALRNFETWAQGKRVSDRQKGWNNVSIGKLATGKQ